MAYIFPSEEWILALKEKLNNDENYAHIAKDWEGDIMFNIEPEGPLQKTMNLYIDLWHGECRRAFIVKDDQNHDIEPAYILSAPYGNFKKVLSSELDPMQAMITRKLRVKGSMAYMMRNVPVVLDFVRCAQEIETEYI